MKIRAAAHGDIDALRAEVAAHRAEHAALLEVYRGSKSATSPTRPPDRHAPCTSTWSCAAASGPRRAPSTGSTKCSAALKDDQ